MWPSSPTTYTVVPPASATRSSTSTVRFTRLEGAKSLLVKAEHFKLDKLEARASVLLECMFDPPHRTGEDCPVRTTQAPKTIGAFAPTPVEFWDGTEQQASGEIDGKTASLAFLLRWIADRSPGACQIPAVVPLSNYYALTLPVTIWANMVMGCWSNRRLRLFQVAVDTAEQGYWHIGRGQAETPFLQL
ncbi:hypothetical protein JCM3770_004468 [Rhodotorula araucariae]